MFKGDCLRVLSPKTEDGNRPRIDDDGQIQYREDFLPLTAKRALERQNNRLPKHLKKIIEPVITREVVKTKATVEMVTSQAVTSEAIVQERKKPGPKPKNAQTN